MQLLCNIMAFAGRQGPYVLLFGVFAGVGVPPLATAARPLMPLAVFVFMLGAFLKADGSALREAASNRFWTVSALCWSMFGVPLLIAVAVVLVRPAVELSQGLLLWALAPPVSSAAAIAVMLGFDAGFALLASVIGTVLAPCLLPALATALTGAPVDINPVAMGGRLAAIVSGAAVAAIVIRRLNGNFLRNNPHALTGFSVFGLLVTAASAMRGMQDRLFTHPCHVLTFFSLAVVVNLACHIGSSLLFSSGGWSRALAVGLVSGNRNVSLLWAAAASFVAVNPDVELFLAMSALAIFTLPACWRAGLNWTGLSPPQVASTRIKSSIVTQDAPDHHASQAAVDAGNHAGQQFCECAEIGLP